MRLPNRLVIAIGVVFLSVGLLAIVAPVFLADHDRWGIQVNCGNGFHSQFEQAAVDDQDAGRQTAPSNDYVDQCKSAVAHRRTAAVPAAGLGAVMVTVGLAVWARRRTTTSGSLTLRGWSPAQHPDEGMYEALDLDRRERPQERQHPHTTL
jgi:hypothetical protein